MAACSGTDAGPLVTEDDAITVASFSFAESGIVAEIYAQALEEAGFPVERLPQVGTRELVMPALQRGLIEVVPEYAGSALSFLGGKPTADEASTHAQLRAALDGRGIDVLAPAVAQNRNAVVVSQATAHDLSSRRISDLIGVAGDMTLGGPAECPDRPLCLPGLEESYDLRFDSFIPLPSGGSLTAEAIERGTVDVGIMFTTDGVLADSGSDLVVLEDDRQLQPAENLTPLVRGDAIERFGPGLAHALDRVSGLLTTDALRDLNDLVERGSDVAAVARSWLDARQEAA